MSSALAAPDRLDRFEADLGQPDFGVGETARAEVDKMLPRFAFSPFLTLNLDSERLRPRTIRAARITVIREFVRNERNFSYLAESDQISRQESLSATEFNDVIVKPGDTERCLKQIFTHSGSLATGFIMIEELLGREPDKRAEDRALILDLQTTLLPSEPKDGPDQLEILEASLAERIAGKPSLYQEVGQRLLDSTLTALAFCEMHRENTILEMETRAAGGEGARGKLLASPFDKMVCAWLRKPIPRITSKLTAESQRIEIVQAPAAAAQPLDAQQIGQAIAMSMPAIITAMKEMGIVPQVERRYPPKRNRSKAKSAQSQAQE